MTISDQCDRRNAANEFTRRRARVAALSRGVRPADDPQLVEARQAMYRAQQAVAGDAILNAIEAAQAGDPAREAEILRSAGVPVGVLLLEAVEILSFLASLSDQPTEMLAGLRERISAASTEK